MRQKHDILQIPQLLRHQRFTRIDIQTRTRDPALLQGQYQCRLVNHITPRYIYKMCAFLHFGNGSRVNHICI